MWIRKSFFEVTVKLFQEDYFTFCNGINFAGQTHDIIGRMVSMK